MFARSYETNCIPPCAGERADMELRPDELTKLRYIQVYIDETIRRWPAVVDKLQQETPPEGLTISAEKKSTWIPGNVIIKRLHILSVEIHGRFLVLMSLYLSAGRPNQSSYSMHLSTHLSSWAFSCVRKRLATMIMRQFIGSISAMK